MLKISLITLAAALLVGCAARFSPTTVLNSGNYPLAYSLVINEKDWSKNKAEVITSILEKTGGAKSDVYYRAVAREIDDKNIKDQKYLLDTARHVSSAVEDKLLTPEQALDLKNKLRDSYVLLAIQSGSYKADENLARVLDISGDSATLGQRALEILTKKQNSTLEDFFPVYEFFLKLNDIDGAQKSIKAMQELARREIKAAQGKALKYRDVDAYVRYIKITGDRTLDNEIIKLLEGSELNRQDILEMTPVFPHFAQKYHDTRVLRINFETNGDDFLLGEIIDEIKKINEWVEPDEEAARKIRLIRLRLNEQRSQPTNSTEIIPDPDFATLLMIPKNASVLIDYRTSDYSLQWNFSVQDAGTKKTKTISGNKRLKKIECRNARFQNVFGGVGALYSYPNARVQNICQSGANVDFDQARRAAIQEMAKEISSNFLER